MQLIGNGGHAKAIRALQAFKKHQQLYALYDSIAVPPCVVAIGDNLARKREFKKVLKPGNITEPLLPNCLDLGLGTVIMSKVHIGPAVKIGKNVIVNTGAIIEHDCIIGDHCHIAIGAKLCGGVEIGEGTLIGAGAIVIPLIKIAPWTIVGAGGVVIRDLEKGTWVGNPVRKLLTK